MHKLVAKLHYISYQNFKKIAANLHETNNQNLLKLQQYNQQAKMTRVALKQILKLQKSTNIT